MLTLLNEWEHSEGIAMSIELENREKIYIYVEGFDTDKVKFEFFKDEEIEEKLDGEFEFENENFNEDFVSSYTKYKLIYMFSPSQFTRMGIGEFILRWFLENTDCNQIYTSELHNPEIKDGTEVTGTGVQFVLKMRDLGLIENPDKEDENYFDYE